MKTICFLLTLACTGVRSGVQDVAACRIAVMDSSTAADSASVAVACRRAVTRYFVLTARQAPTGTVHVGAFNAFAIERAEVPWKFDWPSATSCRRIGVKLGYMQGSDSAFCANEITAVLPHELGHVFNYAGFVAGTASLPAWYDEATAMWMEPDELQMQRLSQAQQWRSSAPDIASLMSAIHPRVGPKHAAFSRTQITGPCRGTCGGRRGWHSRSITLSTLADGSSHADTLYDSDVSSASTDSVARFYVYSLAALYYVKSRGGIEALHILTDRVRVPSHDVDLLNGIPGIPTGREREADWRRWLSTAARTVP